MPEEPFLLVSLEENKAKELAQVISNESCRKIMSLLTQKDQTESEISEKLGIPLSTVHYNMQLLVKGGLVVTEEYHYSKKGREVLHYKLANKYIIIAPTESYNFKEKLKKILPLGVFALVVSGALQLAQKFMTQPVEAPLVATRAMAKSALMAEAAPAPLAVQAPPAEVHIALWFLFGALFSLVVYLLWDYIHFRKR